MIKVIRSEAVANNGFLEFCRLTVEVDGQRDVALFDNGRDAKEALHIIQQLAKILKTKIEVVDE